MPPEWAPHERTLMGWPCRRELWGDQLAAAKAQYAGVANAVAAFEPVTMVAASAADAAEARAALSASADVVELAMDDSWLRDAGPIFTLDERTGARAAVAFAFNAWGEKFHPYDADATLATRLCEHLGEPVERSGLVLEGGSIGADGAGRLVTTEQCLLHPSRNPGCSRAEIEAELRARLGVHDVVWLGRGLLEDRDTDGHVDLIAAFTAPGSCCCRPSARRIPTTPRWRRTARGPRPPGWPSRRSGCWRVWRSAARSRGVLSELLRGRGVRRRSHRRGRHGRRGARARRRGLPRAGGRRRAGEVLAFGAAARTASPSRCRARAEQGRSAPPRRDCQGGASGWPVWPPSSIGPGARHHSSGNSPGP
jgi:hypothetical protein